MAAKYADFKDLPHYLELDDLDDFDDNDLLTLIPHRRRDDNNCNNEDNLGKVTTAQEQEDELSFKQGGTVLPEEHEYGCYSCSSKKTVKYVEEIRPGDHLIQRGRRFFSHHLLCTDIKYFSEKQARMTIIAIKQDASQNSVHKSEIEIDLNNDEYEIVVYQNPKYEHNDVIQRAEQLMQDSKQEQMSEKTEKNLDYNKLLKNSEAFITFCTTGFAQNENVIASRVISGLTKVPWLLKILEKAMDFLHSLNTSRLPTFLSESNLLCRVKNFAFKIPLKQIIRVLSIVGVVLSVLEVLLNVYKLIKVIRSDNLCKYCKKEKLSKYGTNVLVLSIVAGITLVPIICTVGLVPSIALGCCSLAIVGAYQAYKFGRKYFSGQRHDTKTISDCSSLVPGDVIVYKKRLSDHFGIIVNIQTIKDQQMTEIEIVHYGKNSFLASKKVIKNVMTFTTSNPKIKKCLFFERPQFENEIVVQRALSKLDKEEWGQDSSLRKTSQNFCHWCKVISRPNEKQTVSDCSTLVPGDVIVYKKLRTDHYGIVVNIQTIDQQKTKLEIVHYGKNSLNLFASKKVIKTKKTFSTLNADLKKYNFFGRQQFENEIVVQRAVSNIDKEEWEQGSSIKKTSLNFCCWCKLRKHE